MWKDEYYKTDDGLVRELERETDGTSDEKISCYEIIFDVGDNRYYCFVDAVNMDEALGIFFRNHNTVTYDSIVDHYEFG